MAVTLGVVFHVLADGNGVCGGKEWDVHCRETIILFFVTTLSKICILFYVCSFLIYLTFLWVVCKFLLLFQAFFVEF